MMAEWRLVRRWSEPELRERLEALAGLGTNFAEAPDDADATADWTRYRSRSILGEEAPGPPRPDGIFERARAGLINYQFSDPDIVRAHFEPDAPLLGRRMLLELRAVRVLRYLAGVVVGSVRDEDDEGGSTSGFRYDTLEGHIEAGTEWFLVHKARETGTVTFRIEASWRPAQFPNWWSRLGFALVGSRYQRRWHRHAHGRLYAIATGRAHPRGRPTLGAPEVVFERT